jgi:endonuclease V-like protein UPF0215 family
MEDVQEKVTDWSDDAKKNAGRIMLLGGVTAIAGFSMFSVGSAARRTTKDAT